MSGNTQTTRKGCEAMIIAERTHRGNVREHNEDSLYAGENLLIVADGMGGHRGGATASALAIQAVRDGVMRKGILSAGAEDIDAAMQDANRRIYEASLKDDALQGMGTTMTLCIVRSNILVCAHIGDSRAYLFRNGRLSRITRDHSLVEELVRSGYITREQAAVHPHRHVITRALGTDTPVRIDQKRLGVQDGDIVLLCTDGIMLHIPDEEIQALLSGGGEPGFLADELLSRALGRGGEDNISLILARVEGGEAL